MGGRNATTMAARGGVATEGMSAETCAASQSRSWDTEGSLSGFLCGNVSQSFQTCLAFPKKLWFCFHLLQDAEHLLVLKNHLLE